MVGLWTGLAKVVGPAVTRVVGKITFACVKHAPEILMGGRILLTAGGTVAACKATVSAQELLNKYEQDEQAIKTAAAIIRDKQELYKKVQEKEPDKLQERLKERDEHNRPLIMAPSDYTPKDYKMELLQLKGRFIKDMTKTFALSIGLFSLAMICDISCFRIVSNRIAALAMACSSLQNIVKAQQAKIEKLTQAQPAQPPVDVEATVTDENGEQKPVDATTVNLEDMEAPFEIFFGEGCVNWTKDPVINRRFLSGVQTDLNDLLCLRGFVTLNDLGTALDRDFVPRRSWYGFGWSTRGMSYDDIKLGRNVPTIDLGIDEKINEGVTEFVLRPSGIGFILADIPEDEGLHDADMRHGLFSNLNGKLDLHSLPRR